MSEKFFLLFLSAIISNMHVYDKNEGRKKKAFYKSKTDFHVFYFSLCALLLPFFCVWFTWRKAWY